MGDATFSTDAISSYGTVVNAGWGFDPKFAKTLDSLLTTCRRVGLDFKIANGLRTPQVQAEYFCRWQGHTPTLIDEKVEILKDKGAPWLASILLRFRNIKRTKNWLTSQLPGSGWHQWGLAADCYCYRDGQMVEDGDDPAYEYYAQQAIKLGLTAGYFFKSRDAGHVQGPSAAGADNIFTWSHIDEVMRSRFGEKTVVALTRSEKPATLPSGFVPTPERLNEPRVVPVSRPSAAIAAKTLPATEVPPPATAAQIKIRGKSVYGPGNLKFGTVSGPGLVSYGSTTIDSFFK